MQTSCLLLASLYWHHTIQIVKRTLRTLLLVAAAAAAAALLAYVAVIVFLAISERSLVYVSAGEGRRGRAVIGSVAKRIYR